MRGHGIAVYLCYTLSAHEKYEAGILAQFIKEGGRRTHYFLRSKNFWKICQRIVLFPSQVWPKGYVSYFYGYLLCWHCVILKIEYITPKIRHHFGLSKLFEANVVCGQLIINILQWNFVSFNHRKILSYFSFPPHQEEWASSYDSPGPLHEFASTLSTLVSGNTNICLINPNIRPPLRWHCSNVDPTGAFEHYQPNGFAARAPSRRAWRFSVPRARPSTLSFSTA